MVPGAVPLCSVPTYVSNMKLGPPSEQRGFPNVQMREEMMMLFFEMQHRAELQLQRRRTGVLLKKLQQRLQMADLGVVRILEGQLPLAPVVIDLEVVCWVGGGLDWM